MTTLQVMLPDSLKEFLDAQAAAEGYSSASDYVSALLRKIQQRKAWDEIEALVLEGLNSGPAVEVAQEFWEEKQRQLREKH